MQLAFNISLAVLALGIVGFLVNMARMMGGLLEATPESFASGARIHLLCMGLTAFGGIGSVVTGAALILARLS